MRPSASLNREPPARRIGVILSILFLASLGTVASMTSASAGAQDQSGARTAIAALPSATAR